MQNKDKIKITLQDILAIISIIASAHIFTSLYNLNSIASKNGLSSFAIYSWEDVLILNYKINIINLSYPAIGLIFLLLFYVIKHFDKLKISLTLNNWTTNSLFTLVVLGAMFFCFLKFCPSIDQEKRNVIISIIFIIGIFIVLLLYYANTISIKTAIVILTIFCSLVPIISIIQLIKQSQDLIYSKIEFCYSGANGVEDINTESDSLYFIMQTSKGFAFRDTLKNVSYFYENERISNLKITTEEKSKK